MFDHPPARDPRRFDRRQFLTWASSRGLAVGAGAVALPTLLAACGDDDDASDPASGGGGTATTVAEASERAEAVVGDVVDFDLTSDDWAGDFGFVTMAIRPGAFDGGDVWFVRTDTSDQDFATSEQLVHVPKLGTLTGDGLSGNAYIVEDAGDDQPTVFSSEPGRDDYTPAWTLHRVTWTGDPSPLRSERDVLDAEAAGAVTVERTDIVFNGGIVKWSSGEMAVDTVREAYLGEGQLLEPVDTTQQRATFKLSQCYPASRYFVLDHSVDMAAEMTHTVASPQLHEGPSEAGATGRTNVFMNGITGPGPMGFQPSAFDFDAGDPAWSPYWDHWTYAWKDDATPRVLESPVSDPRGTRRRRARRVRWNPEHGCALHGELSCPGACTAYLRGKVMSRQRRRGAAFLLAFGILAAACGDDDTAVAPVPGGTGDDAGEASDGEGGSGSQLNISADDIAFDTDRIDVTAGEEMTVTFENMDDGIQHNLHVTAGDVDVETEITEGPDTQELTFTIEEDGTFICDVHPDQMTGDLVIS